MNSPDDNNKMLLSSPSGKSQGSHRGGYHKNAPYSRRDPLSRDSRDGSRDNSRHRHHKILEKDDTSKSESDIIEKRKDPVIGSKNGHERKFNGRCRLFVGNIPGDMKQDEFKKLFEPFGNTDEVFLNSPRGFGFVKLETRYKAEEACLALDGQPMKNGRNLRVKFTGHNAALKVKYLPQHVSNEMLENTFSMFGEVERAVVVVDDKGKSIGEGIVEFTKKPVAQNAFKRINDGVFLMTGNPRPISVEMLIPVDEWGGLPEVSINKSQELVNDREKPPRFAQPGSFEYEIGQKWKKLGQLYKDQKDLLKGNYAEEVAKLEVDQETALMEQHTLLLRQDIQRRQEELRMLEEQTQNEIKRKLEMRNRMSSNPGLNQMERHQPEDMRTRGRGPSMSDADLRRRHMDGPNKNNTNNNNNNNSPNESFFNLDRGAAERSSLTPLQPPPIPPGVDRVRMGSLNLMGSLGATTLSGLSNNNNNISGPRNIRMEILPRPPMPLLMDPSTPLRPQSMLFDAPQGLRSTGGNLFGLRPQGPGLMQGHSGSHGPVDHSDPKKTRRF